MSPAERKQSKHHVQKSRLPGTVGPEDRHEFAASNPKVDPAPDEPAAATRSGAAELNGGGGFGAHRPVALASAVRMPSNSLTCQASKLAVAGVIVSVTVAIGIPAAFASPFSRWMSGVAF